MLSSAVLVAFAIAAFLLLDTVLAGIVHHILVERQTKHDAEQGIRRDAFGIYKD